MKHKYRLVSVIINGTTYFQIEAKLKGPLGIFFKWSSGWVGTYKDYDLLFDNFEEALDAIRDLRNPEKPIKKVIKGV